MGVFDMFRPTQQVTVAPPANPMAQQNPGAGAPPPPAGQAANAPPPAPAEPANALDTFSSLWQNDPNAAPTADPFAAPLFNTDAGKIHEAAGKMNFLGQVSPELVTKALSGDGQALLDVINIVGQKTLAAATQLNTATVENGSAKATKRILDALPGRVKQITLDGMAPENPALSHPAAQPILQLARERIKMKNPNMTAAQIQTMAEKYVTDFAGTIAKPTAEEVANEASASGGEDWDKFLG